VKESTDQFTVTLLDERGNIILTKPVGTIPPGPYLPALENPAILTRTKYSSVVESLDTPVKATQYSDAHFTFTFHDRCTSYPPEEFFRLGKGDCKDYATFLSYVLAYHGYDARIVAFKYFKNSARNGHVVTLFTDTDGAMYYMTTPDVRVLRSVTSIENLLKKECARLGVQAIANHTVVPAGSLNTCVV
jgi:hypothetical protein